MNRLTSFLSGIVVGAIVVFGAMNFYVIRTSNGFEVVRAKAVPQASFPYVDVRSFTIQDWQSHGDLAAALTKAGKTSILGQSAVNSVGGTVSDAVNNWMDDQNWNK